MDTENKKLTFPDFRDMKVSTKTFIVMTNASLNLDKLYDMLPVNDTKMIPKIKGRRKTQTFILDETSVKEGSIITLRFKKEMKGIELKPKKCKKTRRWFRNSFTVEMFVQGKRINFKVYSNGMFQITGCKLDSQAELCITHMWEYIKDKPEAYTLKNIDNGIEPHFEALFVPAMRNIDFDLGFIIDREKLTQYVSTRTDHHSLLECSYGYTGVNIKIKVDKPISEMVIKKFLFYKEGTKEQLTTYNEYLQLLSEKERIKKINKVRYTTILCFHSGRAIVSALQAEFALESYNQFIKLIEESRDFIEEKLDI